MGGLYGLTVLIIEKITEPHEGSDAILLPGVGKRIEIALRTDEERAELPKKHRVIVDCRLAIADFSIEARNSKMY